MIQITMMALRKAPGEFIYHRVFKHNEEIEITHKGKPIARIIPTDENWIKSNRKALNKLRRP